MSTAPKTVAFHTMGCKLNFSETSTISREFIQQGFKRVDYRDWADIYAGVPVIIGAKGVEKIVELNLSNEEKLNFDKSVKSVKDLYNTAKKIDSDL